MSTYKIQFAGLGASVGCASDLRSGVCGFDSRRVSSILSWRFDHEIFSMVILLSAGSRRAVVSFRQKKVQILVNCLKD